MNVKRNDVIDIMKVFDPDGTDLKNAHRLKDAFNVRKVPTMYGKSVVSTNLNTLNFIYTVQ